MGVVDVINTAKKYYPEAIDIHDVVTETSFSLSTAGQLFSRIRRTRKYHPEIEVFEGYSRKNPNRRCTYIRYRGDKDGIKKQ